MNVPPVVVAMGGRLRARLAAVWLAQPQRVRVLIVVAAVAVTAGLFEVLVFAPGSRELRRLEQRATAAQREVDALGGLSGRAVADRRAAELRFAEQRDELARLDAEVRAAGERTVRPEQVAERLARLVPRDGSLRTTGLGTQAPQPLEGGKLWRHPFSIQFEGDWLRVTEHVRAIEQTLPTVRWRAIELLSPDWPTVRCRLELSTVGEQPVWIRL